MNPHQRLALILTFLHVFACGGSALASRDAAADPPDGMIFVPKQKDPVSRESVYRKIALLRPEVQSTVFSNEGNLEVAIRVIPAALRPGDQIVLLLDGKPVARGSESVYFLEGVDRGAHKLQAQIIGPDADTLISSEQVTFYMRRASVLFRKRTTP